MLRILDFPSKNVSKNLPYREKERKNLNLNIVIYSLKETKKLWKAIGISWIKSIRSEICRHNIILILLFFIANSHVDIVFWKKKWILEARVQRECVRTVNERRYSYEKWSKQGCEQHDYIKKSKKKYNLTNSPCGKW